jgi:hypothetical protein
MIVPSGGLSPDGQRWIAAKSGELRALPIAIEAPGWLGTDASGDTGNTETRSGVRVTTIVDGEVKLS